MEHNIMCFQIIKICQLVFLPAKFASCWHCGMTYFHFEDFYFLIFGISSRRFSDFQRRRRWRQRRTKSQIPTRPPSRRTQGSNMSQGALAATEAHVIDDNLQGNFCTNRAVKLTSAPWEGSNRYRLAFVLRIWHQSQSWSMYMAVVHFSLMLLCVCVCPSLSFCSSLCAWLASTGMGAPSHFVSMASPGVFQLRNQSKL